MQHSEAGEKLSPIQQAKNYSSSRQLLGDHSR